MDRLDDASPPDAARACGLSEAPRGPSEGMNDSLDGQDDG
jgi:hypothetical protein